jgi:hypothetical protein
MAAGGGVPGGVTGRAAPVLVGGAAGAPPAAGSSVFGAEAAELGGTIGAAGAITGFVPTAALGASVLAEDPAS